MSSQKSELIAKMVSDTANDITSDAEEYMKFLITAANNYKYSFKEQLLIFAQKPEATACADIKTWNKLGRWVNRGTKGIALPAYHYAPYDIRYVFDISDTNTRRTDTVTVWQMKPEYEGAVIESLEGSIGKITIKDNFPIALREAAFNMVKSDIRNYMSDLEGTAGEWDLTVFLSNSIGFMLMARCSHDPYSTFNGSDFKLINSFKTQKLISSVGCIVSNVSKNILRNVESTVKTIIKENNITERSLEYGKATVQEVGRLLGAGYRAAGKPGDREVREIEEHLSQRTQGRTAYRTDNDRQTQRTFGGSGQGSERDDGNAHEADEKAGERDGGTQSERSDGVGAPNELDHKQSRGNSIPRTDIHLNSSIPTEESQKVIIAKAEIEKISAFSISQEEIDAVLTRGSGVYEGKYRIYEQYLKKESSAENINFLKEEYGIGGAGDRTFHESHDAKGIKISRGSISNPDAEILLGWNKVEKRIGELIRADRYLSSAEKEYYPEYCRKEMARKERSVISREFISIVLDYNDFQAQIGNNGAMLNQYVLSDCGHCFMTGKKKTTVLSTKGDYIIPLMREAMEKVLAENTHHKDRAASMLAQLHGVHAQKLEPDVETVAVYRSDETHLPYDIEIQTLHIPKKEYRFALGDTVFIGAQEYEIISLDGDNVTISDSEFPLLVKEMSREEFDTKVKENPFNDKYLTAVEEGSEKTAKVEQEETAEEQTEAVISEEPQETQEAEEPKEAEPLTPPQAPIRKEKLSPHILYPEIKSDNRTNYLIENDNIGEGTPLERFNHNKSAIQLLKKLESEHRLANPDEQKVLSEYVGWGGLADYFKEDNPHYSELKELLTDDEYASARESTLTAFYTPPIVIKAIYKALENMNFKTGNILEPSCAIGNFMGLIPDSMSDAKFYGVELDSISGRIAQQLYQKNSIAVQGFEKTKLPDSFFDAAVGNVPFGQFKVLDRKYDKHNFLIHDYFFARTLDKVRPGGIVAFITSRGTMDKENPSVRKYIAQRADLLGAIRLPNNTFKDAAGTEVTSDIIFLQKRDRLIDIEPEWVHLNTDENGIKMNSYFVLNPHMIMGNMQLISGAHGMEPACIAYDGADLGEQLNNAIQHIRGEISEYISEDDEAEEDNSIAADPDVRNFSYTIFDGKIYYRENSRMMPSDVSKTVENRIRGMIEIRDCTRTLIEYQTEDYPDYEIKKQQDKLNELYDDFSKKYGIINSRANNSAFNADSSYSLISSLEVIDDEGNFVRKADMFFKRTIKQKVVVTSVDTASEALALSLAEKTRIDIPYMCELTGKTEEEITDDLKGIIFLNPEHLENSNEPKYLPADEYLSGNVREKLRKAQEYAESNAADFSLNVTALEEVIPPDLSASEISVRLGATWLPPKDVETFMFDLFSTGWFMRSNIHVRYMEYTGEWNIDGKSYDRSNIKVHSTYGTSRINGYKIIEETLNLRDVRIFDYVEDVNGKKTAVLNKKETAIAQGKQQLIKEAFSEWIWKDSARRERLTKLYNEKFNSLRPREYNGEHLNFVGINPEITLRPHQVNAIAHILYGGNTLLAHVVGAGKTFEMVAAAQESKRLGLCQKSLFVVPNHLTEQWAAEYLQLYPSANILVATKKDFETKNRKKFCGRIATGDYDAIIIGHSQFEKIPMSIERQRMILEQQLNEIVDGVAELKRNRGDSFSIKQLEKTKKTVSQKLEKLNDQSRKDDVVTFEELGVDRLFIDEAHYYKNLAAFTKMRNVGGISQTEAQKSSDLYMKCRYLDELTGGKGVVFATGTPISNSMVELYTMQKYLQYDTLRRNNLLHFDAWASTFGETVTAIELAPEGSGYRAKTRFAKFYNLPELMAMFKETADIKTADMLHLPVPEAHFHTVALKPSEQQKEMVEALSERAEKVRNKMVNSNEDNMLLITNDGRKLALDQRLMNEMLPDSETSKVSACADNVFNIWQRTAEQKSTQMVFCDLSTPHGDDKFNVYDDLRDKLIAKGIPAEEIAYIHSANTEAQKKEMFGKVRSGQIRVLIGSTQKMGAGTNVQKRLIALHHLDCPWRPSDLQQREGRIIRQGNENPEVDIYTYVTENTFDSYLYQLVESKQKFIGQIMTSKSPVRSAEDVDEQALSYAEIKALCTGNPYIKEKMDLDIEVSRLKLLRSNHLSQRYALEDKILKEFPQDIAALEQRIAGFRVDMQTVSEHPTGDSEHFCGMMIGDIVYSEKKDAGEAIIAACKNMTKSEAVRLGSYRGFDMELNFDPYIRDYTITLKGKLRHTAVLGTDIYGNIQRLDNVLDKMQEKQNSCIGQLENIRTQLENAKIEVEKPFSHEEELKIKSARLAELNALLDMDKKDNEIVDGENENDDIEKDEIIMSDEMTEDVLLEKAEVYSIPKVSQKERKENLKNKVAELVESYKRDPSKIAEYLMFSARFNKYTAHNLSLIYTQYPTASFCASFNEFKRGVPDKDGNKLSDDPISVKKGERAIYILAPFERKYYVDPNTNAIINKSEMSKEELQTAKDEKWNAKTVTYFNPVPVFDIAQTDAPKEIYPKLLGFGEMSNAETESQIRGMISYSENELGCKVHIEDFEENKVKMRGFFRRNDNTIHLSDLLSGDGMLSTLIHEIGHAELHRETSDRSGTQKELEADMYALMVQSNLGIEVNDARKNHLAIHYREYLDMLKSQETSKQELSKDDEVFSHVIERYQEQMPKIRQYIDAEQTVNAQLENKKEQQKRSEEQSEKAAEKAHYSLL